MPRPLSIATALEKSNTSSGTAFLALLEVNIIDPSTKLQNGTLHVVNNNESIEFEGNTYTPTVFDLTFSESSGEEGQATVSINDFDRYIRQQEEAVGGSVGFTVRVLIVNSAILDESPELDVTYTVTSSSSQGYRVTWNLGAENVLALAFPKYVQYKDRCRFKYKGAACGSTSIDETCSLTLDGDNGCASKKNTIRFGGFPGLNN